MMWMINVVVYEKRRRREKLEKMVEKSNVVVRMKKFNPRG